MAKPILIIGASGRAAAFSALGAGWTPHVIDLFADEDLRAVAEVRKIPGRDYPRGFVELAREFPPMPFMYTGGLENHPDVIAAISAERPLIGNGPPALRKVRDPFALAELGIRTPQVRRCDDPPTVGRWLVKPLRGSGGSGIRFATAGQCSDHQFFQEFIEGESRSAIFRDGELLGVTRQLVGEPWLHAPRFSYCGSLGPLAVSRNERIAWQQLGVKLTDWGDLRGLFGVDAIVRDGEPCLIEVNPRYTASVEVIEWRNPSVRAGVGAGFGPSPPAPLPQSRERGESIPAPGPSPKRGGENRQDAIPPRLCHDVGSRVRVLPSPPASGGEGMGVRGGTLAKAIYYAPHTLTIPHNGPWEASLRNLNPLAVPEYADIPRAGSSIERGRPLMTIFGRDESELRRRASELDAIFQLEHVPCR